MSRMKAPLSAEEKDRRRWEGSAVRANERLMRKEPLFVVAGLTPLVTPEERKAKLGNARANAELAERERIERDRLLGVERRAAVQGLVTAEEFAHLEARGAGPWWADKPGVWWGYVHSILTREEPISAPPVALAPRKADVDLVQGPLFVATPAGEIVPAVADGRAVSLDDLKRQHLTASEPRPQIARWSVCPGCGWRRPAKRSARDEILTPIRVLLHPAGCPHMRATYLCGVVHRHIPCDERPCALCQEATRTCQRDGCVWGPPRPERVQETQRACQRCWIAESALPYLPWEGA